MLFALWTQDDVSDDPYYSIGGGTLSVAGTTGSVGSVSDAGFIDWNLSGSLYAGDSGTSGLILSSGQWVGNDPIASEIVMPDGTLTVPLLDLSDFQTADSYSVDLSSGSVTGVNLLDLSLPLAQDSVPADVNSGSLEIVTLDTSGYDWSMGFSILAATQF